jgi:cyclopropane fatty-acyl-phospholipid synthase-like methyltransferase
MSEPSSDFFFNAYDRDEIAYGLTPSASLAAYLEQFSRDGLDGGARALDLGAGAGRDTLAMAKAGFHVTSVDISERGLQRIVERAEQFGVGDRVTTQVADVRKFTMPANHYDVVIGTTVLDHVPAADAKVVWSSMVGSLCDQGVLFAEVHTTEDPGSPVAPGCDSEAPVSETAGAVVNYFSPNQLASWALEPQSKLRILNYEERLEWDYTHGAEHMHGKAILLAVRSGYHPNWYGQPAAFPRQK